MEKEINDKLLKKYVHLEKDNDGNFYRFNNEDVKHFTELPHDILLFLNDVSQLIKKHHIENNYYIKWNHLYFMIDNNKFCYKLSDFIEEYFIYRYLEQVLLYKFNCKDVCFDFGVLD